MPRPPRRALLRLLPVLAVLTAAAPARADGGAPPPLGKLEQESVDEALAGLGLRVDPHPEGKTIRNITAVNQEVFSRRDWWFQWLNHFHRTTRPYILERELLLRPGQPYDQSLVEESTRNLQTPAQIPVGGRVFTGPDLSSVVVLLPVVSPVPGTVDLLAVTRDLWSLRFNTVFEFQQNTLSSLATSLSENNLFGWRKYLAVGFSMDQGSMWVGPTYFDPNIAGTRLQLYASANAYYTRLSSHYEGNTELFSLRYPLFSLASRWGAGVDVRHQDVILRSFRGNVVRLVPVLKPDGTTEDARYEYRRKITAVDASASRQTGQLFIHQVTFGYHADGRRSEVLPNFAMPLDAPFFLDQYTPVTETRSEPYVQYHFFTARYAVYRDLNTFDLRENAQLGPSATVRVAYGAPELGATFRTVPLSASLGWNVGTGDWLATASVSGSTRLRDGSFIDQTLTGQAFGATPRYRRLVRLVLAGQAAAARNDTQKTLYALGGDNGLRGYAIGDFLGTSLLVAHVELRTMPLAIFSQRFGAVAFYDVGDAASSFSTMFAKHDLGLGLRWLIPQLNPTVIRFDWAIATQSTGFTRAGFPGRFSAGFQQGF
jgi:hypothetical protein